MGKGILSLLPNPLNKEASPELFLPSSVFKEVNLLQGLIAESEKEARRYLKELRSEGNWKELPIKVYNEHSGEDLIDELLLPLKEGERWGFISDAGMPCLADPGHLLVARARKLGIIVKAFIGPSAPLIALMLSGLPAQRFAFRGYLPRDEKLLKAAILRYQTQSKEEKSTQLFIEAPYRNDRMLKNLIETLDDSTLLSVCSDLTLPSQGVETEPVHVWKKRSLPVLHKKPAVFLFAASQL